MSGVFSDFLSALRVPHTDAYSTQRFMTMPFMSMFGMVNLLREYGVDAAGYDLSADKSQLSAMPLPVVAPVSCGRWLVVTDVTPKTVKVLQNGSPLDLPRDKFEQGWTGVVLTGTPSAGAAEPHYRAHRLTEVMNILSRWGTAFFAVVLTALIIILNGLWRTPEIIPIAIVDGIGLTLSILLMLKNNGVHTRAADNVCGIIQRTGCKHVMDSGGTFLGIFHWSEVGVAYFAVSLAAIVLYPQTLPWLAVINLCCLPYTIWSVSYQRFKAHAWCTLCLGVQLSLWLLFAGYICTDWWDRPFGSWLDAAALISAYALTMLVLNHISTIIKRFADASDNNDSSADARE